jgi:hypothetical protein
MINSSDKIIGKVEYCTNRRKINDTTGSSFKLIFINLFLFLTYAIALVNYDQLFEIKNLTEKLISMRK